MQRKLIVYRKNGSPVDVTAYLNNAEIDNGSATDLGESGVDGVASTLSFTLTNAKEVNYCPLVEYGANISEEISITGTGATTYPCQIWILEETIFTDNEEITVKLSGNNFVFNRPILAGETIKVKYTRYDLTVANPINSVLSAYNPLLDEGAKVEFFVNDEEWKSTSQAITGNGSKRHSITSGYAIDKTCYCLSDAEIACTIDATTNEVVFNRNIESYETVTISYSYYENLPSLLFSGYISADISIDGEVDTVQVFCSDKAWRLQKKYIDNLETNVIRTYEVETLLAETLMQNILDDLFGSGEIALYVPVATGQQIEITSNEWGGKTAWDCLQSMASSIGWFLGYEYNASTNDFELYLRSVPRSKNTVDFTLDYKEDILPSSPLVINGSTIYNVLYLHYTDKESGKVEYVKSENAASIANYLDRVGIITESSTIGINNATQAQQLANDIISDICTKVITLNVEIPLKFSYNNNRIKFFNTFAINYPKMSSLIEFFSIEGIKHSFDFAGNSFKTVFTGNMQKVRGGNIKWTNKIRRPEGYRQITSREIGAVNLLKKPSSLIVVDSGIDKLDLASSAYAVLQWNRPLGEYPKKYVLQVRKSTETYENSVKYDVVPDVVAGSEQVRQRIAIQTGIDYKFRVYAVDTSGIKGDVSDEGTINQVGDTVPPAVVSGVSVSAGVKQLIVEFTPNTTDADFLKYRIYYNKGTEPTKATTTYKETASTKTTIDNLDTDANYYVRVTAFDTSKNESDLSIDNKFAKPSLVSDDIFAEIRDKTLHIKTNAQMQQWIYSLNDVTSPSEPTFTHITNYNTVKIYDTVVDYTITRGIALSCADSFSIIGVGKPKLKISMGNTSNKLYIKSTSFFMDNMSFEFLTTTGSLFYLKPYIIGSEKVNYNLNVKNSYLKEGTSVRLPSDTLHAVILGDINNCIFEDSSIWIYNQYYSSKINISNNIFKNTGSVIVEGRLTDLIEVIGSWSSCIISRNSFENCGIEFPSGFATRQLKISENNFNINYPTPLISSLTTAIIYIYSDPITIQGYIINNNFRVNISSATFSNSINVIYAEFDFIYGQVSNNSFYSDNPTKAIFNSWINIATGISTGTIIANNTNN